jgi:hypothetical protein
MTYEHHHIYRFYSAGVLGHFYLRVLSTRSCALSSLQAQDIMLTITILHGDLSKLQAQVIMLAVTILHTDKKTNIN